MEPRLILLTDKAFSEEVNSRLTTGGLRPAAIIDSLDGLKAAATQSPSPQRLVSFGSNVIVPPDLLKHFFGAYNFHPGPPVYRGLFPSVFALYDSAAKFGVTCHEMSADVDAGSIVAVERFAIPNNANREQLDALTYAAMLALVERLAPQLADLSKSLAPVRETWSGPVRRRADFDGLCRLPANVSADEFQRRYRAIGEGPHHALSIELHGRTFKLESERKGLRVVRGGREIN